MWEQCLIQYITAVYVLDADFQYFGFIFNSVAHFGLIVSVYWPDPFSDCLSLLQQTLLGLACCIQSSRVDQNNLQIDWITKKVL